MLKEDQALHRLDEAGSQVVTRVGPAVFTRLMHIHTWCLPVSAGFVREGINTETMAADPPVLTLRPHNTISPWISLASTKFRANILSK